MLAVIFSSEESAQSFHDSMDISMGYPKVGINHNGGLFEANAITLSATYILIHPNGDRWAVVLDQYMIQYAQGKTVENLTDDWFPNPLIDPNE